MKKIQISIFVLIILAGGMLAFLSLSRHKSSPIIFVPYENTGLKDRAMPSDVPFKKAVERKIETIQSIIVAFDTKTSTEDKINNYFALSAELQILGRYKEAKKELENALLLKNDAHILHAYASLLFQMGAGKDSLKYLDDAIKQAPDVANFWRTKIELSQALTKDVLSLDSLYQEALKSTKEDVDMLTLYATYLAQIWEKKKAIEYWKKALEKNPSGKDMYESEIRELQ